MCWRFYNEPSVFIKIQARLNYLVSVPVTSPTHIDVRLEELWLIIFLGISYQTPTTCGSLVNIPDNYVDQGFNGDFLVFVTGTWNKLDRKNLFVQVNRLQEM